MTPMLTTMIEAAIAASAEINAVYAAPFTAEWKSDGSPVTEADGRAEAVILDRLAPLGLPVLAEEGASSGSIPVLGDRYFVVDPLDGTREFLKRNGEFTVNIALVEHGSPTFGVVLAPVTGELYVGSPDGGFAGIVRDGAVGPLTAIAVDTDGPLRVVASRSHGHAALDLVCSALAVTDDVSVGSSLKFCLLAKGAARLYPRFTPTSEWDTAAGQAVLEAAGGVVLTLDGSRLGYGKSQRSYLNPFFVAASSLELGRRAAEEMCRALAFAPA
jgi:3'(2'), 5'-bisphosphate nucleotidase